MLNPYKTSAYKILESRKLTPDQVWLKVETDLRFLAGQFIEISLPGYGEGPVAPCSDPNIKGSLEIVVRNVGSLTKAVNNLLEGDEIFIRGPYGNSWPLKDFYHKDIVIISGGLGIVPIRPLLFELMKNTFKYGNTTLLMGARNPDSFIFKEDFEVWHKYFNYFKTIVDQAPDNYKGRTGVITELLKPLKFNPKKTVAVMCGPEVMCPFCVETLGSKDIAFNNVYVSMERRMRCGIGLCQHCNCGELLVCKDGPIFTWDDVVGELKR